MCIVLAFVFDEDRVTTCYASLFTALSCYYLASKCWRCLARIYTLLCIRCCVCDDNDDDDDCIVIFFLSLSLGSSALTYTPFRVCERGLYSHSVFSHICATKQMCASICVLVCACVSVYVCHWIDTPSSQCVLDTQNTGSFQAHSAFMHPMYIYIYRIFVYAMGDRLTQTWTHTHSLRCIHNDTVRLRAHIVTL